jgi:DNA polymerase-3 subunit alpha
MFGLADFYKQAIKAKIKPILGVETYVTLSDPLEKKRADHRHLVLLAKNYKGYENIVKLVSLANIEGFYYEPCVTKKQLAENCEGIIALSACLSGEIPRAIVENRDKDAYDAAVFYKDLFGDDFYLELQKNGLKDQEKANFGLIELSKRLGIKCVATCDAHYLERHEAVAQDIMFCISAQTTLDDKDRFHSDTDEIYFKTPDEMAAAFAEWPWAIENTLEVDSKIERFSILRPKHILPKFPAPDGETEESYLRRKATEGLNYRLANKTSNLPDSDYWQRLEYELSVIISMGFAGYYLIVADFINWAKENGIFVGPGRGSAQVRWWPTRLKSPTPTRSNTVCCSSAF